MSWFKIDDGFWAHPKILKLSPGAIALWVRAGSWCSAQLTDGQIEPHVMPMFLATPEATQELVDARLWHVPGDRCEDCEAATTMPERGYLFHDWLKYQRSREEVLAEREANRQRQIRARKKAKDKRDAELSESVSNDGPDDVSHAERNGVTHVGHNGPPDPTRPDPTKVTTDVVTSSGTASGAKKDAKGTRIPDEFYLTPDMKAFHAERFSHVDIRLETEKFVNYYRAKTGKDATRRDWPRTWQNWIITASERSGRSTPPRPTKTQRAMSVLEMGERRQAARDRGELER